MAKISSFVAKLKADFPAVIFEESDDFYWSPTSRTVYFDPKSPVTGQVTLLHELSHALLDHRHYTHDIELLKLERQAWDYAKETLAPRYGLSIDEDTVESMIDTYREWLHARSVCPHCSLTGIQRRDMTYHCLGCTHNWKVNDARRCGLKRYSLVTN
jgi:hypothetical protein